MNMACEAEQSTEHMANTTIRAATREIDTASCVEYDLHVGQHTDISIVLFRLGQLGQNIMA